MTPQDVRTRREALVRAGGRLRARPFAETLEALGRVLEIWRDPGSSVRRALEAELPAASGFTPETVRAGLDLALADWTADALTRLANAELGAAGTRGAPVEPSTDTGATCTTALVLAGSIPMPSLLSMLAPLVLRSPVLVKAASRDPVTPRLVARSLAEVDPLLGECVAVLDLSRDARDAVDALLESECVVATGSDETLAALRARLPAGSRFVGHGHRLSLAALGPAACVGEALGEASAGLALDVALWDQQGCLSPLAVFVPSSSVETVGEALAQDLARLEERMPRGAVEPLAAAAIAAERAEAELRAAAGQPVRLLAGPGTSWTVVCEPVPALRPAPLHRFVRVFGVADADALFEALAPYAAHLAGVALDGFGALHAPIGNRLRELGASRVCAPGRLQAPPLDWPRDGHRVLASLLPPRV